MRFNPFSVELANVIGQYRIPNYYQNPRRDLLSNRPFKGVTLDQDRVDTITAAAETYDGHLNRVRPHKAKDGLEHAEELIAGLHNDNVSESKVARALDLAEEPQRFTFELLLKDENIYFHWGMPDTVEQREFRQQVSGYYPNSEIKPVETRFPDIEPGMVMSGGTLEFFKEKYRPLKTLSGDTTFDTDPYRGILNELIGYSNETAIVQFVFTPAGNNWTKGRAFHENSADVVNNYLNWGRDRGSFWNPRHDDPTSTDLEAARKVIEQQNKQAFHLNIRYLVFAPTEDIATSHAHGIGSAYSSLYHNDSVGQGLVPLTYHGDGLVELARRTAAREFHYEQTAVNVEELAALAHLPSEDVQLTNVDWTRKGVGHQPPAEAKRTLAPPDMQVNRNLDELADNVSALGSLADIGEDEETSPDDSEPRSSPVRLFKSVAQWFWKWRHGDTVPDDDTEPASNDGMKVTEIDSEEKQASFKRTYRRFINGELTREQMADQFNPQVAENLIEKFAERRAKEIGVDRDQLGDSEVVFDIPNQSPTDDKTDGDEHATPETDTDTTSTATESASSATATPETANDTDATTEDTTGGLPVRPDDASVPETTDDETLPEPGPGVTGIPAHESNYEYDQQSTSVHLRREPALQQYFPFELTATASGAGEAQEGDIFAGFDVRDRYIHAHRDNPSSPIWLGYDTNPMDGIREVGIEEFSWFKHMTIFGSTGNGKSTALNTIMNQIARKGYGFAFIDPKGDTVDDLVRQLPEDRMDDVIWIEPGSETFNKVAGINFLEPGNADTETEFDREVESIVNDLRAVLRGGEYWGPKMEGITSNIARAMIRSRRDFTLVDMYYVLADNESRQKFANVVSQEGLGFIHEYTTKIAQMDEEEIDPMLRRIQDWVEDPVSRGIVAHRDGTVNISEAVENGKIILVRNTVRSEEIRKVVSTGIMRRIWATIRKREKIDEADREPFFAIMDEFDDIASENMALDKMLSKARSGKMGVITCLQNPSQVRDIAPQTLKQMFSNSDTLLSFGVTEVEDARIIAERFDDDAIDKGTLMSLPAYTALTTISVMDEDGPKVSDPLAPDMFAPYPPRRTSAEAEERIKENLQEYGVSPLEQKLDESEHALVHIGGDHDITKSFLEAVWAGQIRQNALDTLPASYETLDAAPTLNATADTSAASTDGRTDAAPAGVAVADILDGFERRTDREFGDIPSGILLDAEAVEVIDRPETVDTSSNQPRDGSDTPAEKVRIENPNTVISITDAGIRSVLEQQGKGWRHDSEKHNEVLRRAFVTLSAIGMHVIIVTQDDKEVVPDAVAYPPIDTTVDTKRAQQLIEQFTDEYPIAAELSDGGGIAIEAETSTYTKPAATLENLAQATRQGYRTLFFTPEMEAQDRTAPAARINHILTDPLFIRDHLRVKPNEDDPDEDIADREPMPLYYNKTEFLNLGTPDDDQRKHALIESGKQAVWVNTGDDTVRLYDGMSGAAQCGRLRKDEAYGSTNVFDVWCRLDTHNDEWVVYPEGETIRYQTLKELRKDWQLVYEPFVPEREFETQPGTNEWDIIQTALPEFLSPAEDKPSQQGVPEEGLPEAYDNIADVPQVAATGEETDVDDEETDTPVRAGFTREAVPVPERVHEDKLPGNPDSITGESVAGGEQLNTIPSDVRDPLIDSSESTYRELDALVFDHDGSSGATHSGDAPGTDDPPDSDTPPSTDTDTDTPDSTSGSERQATPASDTDATADTETSTAGQEAPTSTAELEERLEQQGGILDETPDDTGSTPDDADGDNPPANTDTERVSSVTPTDHALADTDFTPTTVMIELDDAYILNAAQLDDDATVADVRIDADAVTNTFGAKDPTSSGFWTRVWDAANLGEQEAIYRENLPGALRLGPGLADSKAPTAVRLGIAAEAIIPMGDDAVRLPGPRDAYEEHLAADKPEHFQQWETWADLWENNGLDRDQLLDLGELKTVIQLEYRFTDTVSVAAVGAGVDAGVLREADKRVGLGSRQVPSFWQAALKQMESEPHNELLPQLVHAALVIQHDLTEETADYAIDAGIECGILYGDRDDGPLRVNTPRDERGPAVDDAAFDTETYYPEDVAIDSNPSDDDPDGDAGQPPSDPSGQPSGQPPSNPSRKPSGKPSGNPSGQPSGNISGDLSGNISDEESTEISSQQTAEESSEIAAEEPTQQSAQESPENPTEKADATSHETSTEVSTESSPEESPEESAPESLENSTEESGQQSPQKSSENSTGESDEVSDEIATEIPDEISRQESGSPTQSDSRTPPQESTEVSDEIAEEIANEISRQESTEIPEAESTQESAEGASDGPTDASPPEDRGDDTEPYAEPNSTLATQKPAAARLSPTPTLPAVQAALEHAARFFHDQLDTTIEHNVAWNDDTAFEAGYRMPETPREYFTTLDADPVAYPVTPAEVESTPMHPDEQSPGVEPTTDAKAHSGPAEAVVDDGDDDPTPYRYLGANTRGWPEHVVTDKQLGWAPADATALFEHLHAEGFSHQTLVATGLFTKPTDAYGENEAGEGYVDYTRVEDPDPLTCLFRGRYVFPYYDADGKVAFFIARKPDFDTEYGTHPDDFVKGKYAKLATRKPFTLTDEPIYGRETIRDGAPLVITEGMADAITAHAHGIPCISPVTKSFKLKHREVLTDIIRERHIPDVYFLQDSDPPLKEILAESDRDHDTRQCARQLAIRELFCTGPFPGSDRFTPELVVQQYHDDSLQSILDDEDLAVAPPADPDTPADEQEPVTAEEVPVHLLDPDTGQLSSPTKPRQGPISEALDVHHYGSGVDSAVKMGLLLDAQTPSADATQTGTLAAAADVYHDHVIDADDPADTATLENALSTALSTSEIQTTTPEVESAENTDTPDSRPNAAGDDEGVHEIDLTPTDVWLIELPQFGDEKRDLDDYLQEGWLGVMPPADWALQTATESRPTGRVGGGDRHATPAGWMDGLVDTETTGEYPSRFDPATLAFPPVDAPVWTLATESTGTVTDGTLDTVTPVVDEAALPADATTRLPADSMRSLFTTSAPINSYPALGLFGVLPTLHPSQHPTAGPTPTPTTATSSIELEVDADEVADRVDEDDYRELTGRHNPIWQLTLRDVGLRPGSRGKNPLGHIGASENYFVVGDRGETAYCHKREATYNFQHFALCDMGHRDASQSVTGTSLDGYEYYLLWEYSRDNGLVPAHTPIPMQGIKAYALTHDFCTTEDLVPIERDDGDAGEDGEDDDRPLRLPWKTFFDVLRDIESKTGHTPARLAADRDREDTDDDDAIDTESIGFEYAKKQYGLYNTSDTRGWLPPEKQFLIQFTETEDGEITKDTDETKYAVVKTMREAYNAWVEIVHYHHYHNTDRDPKELEIEKFVGGQFINKISNQIDVELKKGQPTIDSKQKRVRFGVELVDDAKELAELHGKFTIDD